MMTSAQYSQMSANPRPTGAVSVCCCGSFNGNIVTFYSCGHGSKSFPYTCLLGPDWPCLLCTYTLIAVPSLFFAYFVAPILHVAAIVVFALMLFWTIASLTLTACSDPGVIYRKRQSEVIVSNMDHAEGDGSDIEGGHVDQDTTLCQYCRIRRGPTVHHCEDCNSCIDELDHHCPWTGKCIGKHNLTYFRSFLFSIVALVSSLVCIGFMVLFMRRH